MTLFNALTPGKALDFGIQSLPSIHGYGLTQVETHRQDRRTVTQKSIDAFAGLLTFRTFSYVMIALAKNFSLNTFHIAKKYPDVIHIL